MHFAHKDAPAWTRKDHLQAYIGRFILALRLELEIAYQTSGD